MMLCLFVSLCSMMFSVSMDYIKLPLERLLEVESFKEEISKHDQILVYRTQEMDRLLNMNQQFINTGFKKVKVISGSDPSDFIDKGYQMGDVFVIQNLKLTDDKGKLFFTWKLYKDLEK